MTKKFVADESIRSKLLDRMYDLVRRVKDGTLDGGKILHQLQWLIEDNDIIPVWREEEDPNFLMLLLEYQIEEKIRVGYHVALGMSAKDYRSSLLQLREIGTRDKYSYPVIVDTRIDFRALLRFLKIACFLQEDLIHNAELPGKIGPYVLWVVPHSTDWNGLSVKELMRNVEKGGAGQALIELLTVRELVEYTFHFPDKLPDPRATSVRRLKRIIAGETIKADYSPSRFCDFTAVWLGVESTEKGDVVGLGNGPTAIQNVHLPHWRTY